MQLNLLVHSNDDTVPDDAIRVNATSRTKEKWSLELSPFYVGPIPLYDGFTALNLENAWQYSKVYHHHLGEDGKPTQAYWDWAKEGWANPKPVRFPMGRDAIPAGSWWNGRLINYVEARMTIYCPLYAQAVTKTNAFAKLQNLYAKAQQEKVVLAIFDFDGHNSIETFDSFDKLVYNNTMKLGHGFVLAMLLANQRPWEKPFNTELEHYTFIPPRKNSRVVPVASKTQIRVQNFGQPVTEEQVAGIFKDYSVVAIKVAKGMEPLAIIEFENPDVTEKVFRKKHIFEGNQLQLTPKFERQ